MHWRSHVRFACFFLVLSLVRGAAKNDSAAVTVPLDRSVTPDTIRNSKDLSPSTTTLTRHGTHTITVMPVTSDGSTFIPKLTHHITDPFHRSQNPAFTDPPTLPPAVATFPPDPSDPLDPSADGSTGQASGNGSSGGSHHQSPVAIFFEVAGSIVGLAVLLMLGRCVYRYRRTPGRDRIAGILDRHRLERELAEIEEAAPGRRTSVVRNPPPPYQRAPEYMDVIEMTPSPTVSPAPTTRTCPTTPSTSATPVSAMSARSDRPLIHGYMNSIGSSEGSEDG